MIDLSKYVLPDSSSSSAQITDSTDLAALAELNGMPLIAKFAKTRIINAGSTFTETATIVMNYIAGFDFEGYIGSLPGGSVVINNSNMTIIMISESTS